MSVNLNFVNRVSELAALEKWWRTGRDHLALVWGRRRVGKTWLIEAFANDKPAIVHIGASRPASTELSLLQGATERLRSDGPSSNPFHDWDDALERIARLADRRRILLVLDEFPELLGAAPELPGVLRAYLERARSSHLKILLCGSAARIMQGLEEERAPLYGRVDLSLTVHPFAPHEAAMMLRRLRPADRALVWGLLGGIPLYLSWWDQDADVATNLRRLVAAPSGRLLSEGQLVLATELDTGDLTGPVLRAIGSGATKHNEIADLVRAEPARTLDRLVDLRLVERMAPVTDDPRRTRRRVYRIADNLLAFYLGVVDRHRAEIERGLGESILPVIMASLDDALDAPWEEAFRIHLRRLAVAGELAPDVVAIGRFWRPPDIEIDAVALSGRRRSPVLVGEAKWARSVNARSLEPALLRRASLLPDVDLDNVRLAVAARERVERAADTTLTMTAADIFG